MIKFRQRSDGTVVITSFVANAQLGAADDVRRRDPGVYAERHVSIAHRYVVNDRGNGLGGQEELLGPVEPIGSFISRTVSRGFRFHLLNCHFKDFPSAGVTGLGS